MTRWTKLLYVNGKPTTLETTSTDVNAALNAASEVHGRPLAFIGAPNVDDMGRGRNAMVTFRVKEIRKGLSA